MSKYLDSTILILGVLIAGCSAGDGGFFPSLPTPQSQQSLNEERQAIIERMVPEEGSLPSNRLRNVVEAITTVVQETEKEQFQLNRSSMRRYLVDRNLSDLRRIESALLAIEKRRREEGLD